MRGVRESCIIKNVKSMELMYKKQSYRLFKRILIKLFFGKDTKSEYILLLFYFK